MRRNCVVSLLAVIALCWALAACCSVSWAEPSGVNYRWGGSTPTQVVVDGEYAKEHPEQVGIQGVVVDTRNRVAVLETDVKNLQDPPTPPPTKTPATMNMNGGAGTTINNNFFSPQPNTPGATAPPAGSFPPPPPSGGPASTPAPPVKEGSGMSIGAIIGLAAFVVGVVILFMWLGPTFTENARMRRADNDQRLATSSNQANRGAIGNNGLQHDVVQRFPDIPAYAGGRDVQGHFDAAGNYIGCSDRHWTPADARAWVADQAAAGGALPGGAPPPPMLGPGNPEIVAAGMSLTRATTVALATTAVPPVIYPVGTVFPQASATSPAGTQDNLEALAANLVGLPTLTQPVVDPIRDALAIAGTIKL